MTDPREIAASLTEAQRVIMLGHLVEITPEEAEQLEEWGLKLAARREKFTVEKLVWPITDLGLAVRHHLEGKAGG